MFFTPSAVATAAPDHMVNKGDSGVIETDADAAAFDEGGEFEVIWLKDFEFYTRLQSGADVLPCQPGCVVA